MRNSVKDQARITDSIRMSRKRGDILSNEEFIEAKDRLPFSTAEAEGAYMKMVRDDAQ